MAPASVQRGGAEGAESRFRWVFIVGSRFPRTRRFGFIDSAFGGAHGRPSIGLKLRTSIFVAFCNDI